MKIVILRLESTLRECLKNYDLSMEFYNRLDINKYNKIVEKIIKNIKWLKLKV